MSIGGDVKLSGAGEFLNISVIVLLEVSSLNGYRRTGFNCIVELLRLSLFSNIAN